MKVRLQKLHNVDKIKKKKRFFGPNRVLRVMNTPMSGIFTINIY